MIYVFTATDPECPAAMKWVAGNLPDGSSVPNFYCCSDSPQGARDKMEAFLHPPKRIADTKKAVIVPGELEPEPVSEVADDDDEVL